MGKHPLPLSHETRVSLAQELLQPATTEEAKRVAHDMLEDLNVCHRCFGAGSERSWDSANFQEIVEPCAACKGDKQYHSPYTTFCLLTTG